jgi:hypothetical protein
LATPRILVGTCPVAFQHPGDRLVVLERRRENVAALSGPELRRLPAIFRPRLETVLRSDLATHFIAIVVAITPMRAQSVVRKFVHTLEDRLEVLAPAAAPIVVALSIFVVDLSPGITVRFGDYVGSLELARETLDHARIVFSDTCAEEQAQAGQDRGLSAANS